ncbi:MAG TPA: FtsX-like permease family protein [Dehalococcoidia bacterium]|jgi:ABC-type antimicrobial peptide transport system permease subunit
MFYYAIKELLKRKKLHLLNVMTIGLVTLMVITLNSLASAYRDAARLPFEDIQGNIIIQRNGNVPETTSGVLLSCSLAPIPQELISQIGRINGVKDISAALSLWVFDSDNFKRVSGVDFHDNFGKKLTAKLIDGSVPNADNQILVDKTYAQKYSLEVDRETTISGQHFTVAGIVGTAGNEVMASDIYLDLGAAQEMAYQSQNLQQVETFNKTDVNIIFINVSQPDLNAVTQKINGIITDSGINAGKTPLGQTIGSYNIYTPQSFENQISTVFRISDKLTWLISIILFIGAAVIIARNILRMILERRREFGIMKTVGFRNRDIQSEINSETFLQILTGFFAGIILSIIAIIVLSHTTVSIAIPWELTAYPHFLLANPNDANVTQTHLLPIKLEPLQIFISFIVIMAVGMSISFLSVWQINKLKPMEVMRHE